MIECAWTPGAIGSEASVRRSGFDQSMLSIDVGNAGGLRKTRSVLSSVASSSDDSASEYGAFTSLRASIPSQFSARKLPRWGVEMKITRVTNGSGSKNAAFSISARVFGLIDTSSNFRSVHAAQKALPLDTTIAFAS